MNKNIVAGLVALILILVCGITEFVVVSGKYNDMTEQCKAIINKVENGENALKEYENFSQKWEELKTLSELLLPHSDIYELNLRIAEAYGYIKNDAIDDALTQLNVIKVLLEYVPDNVIPDFHHIV